MHVRAMWIAAFPRRRLDPPHTRKESSHEDHPPDAPLTATHARRHANSQLLTPHHRRVSALRRPICQTFPHLPRSSRRRAYPHLPTPSPPPAGLEEHLYPDRVCPAIFLRGLAAAAARKPTVTYYTRYFSYLQSGFLPMELASYSDAYTLSRYLCTTTFPKRVPRWERTESATH